MDVGAERLTLCDGVRTTRGENTRNYGGRSGSNKNRRLSRGVICAINKYGMTGRSARPSRGRPVGNGRQIVESNIWVGRDDGPLHPGMIVSGGTLTCPGEYIVPVGRGAAYDVRYVRPDGDGGSNSGK